MAAALMLKLLLAAQGLALWQPVHVCVGDGDVESQSAR
jgi:hypothetical protein